MPGTVQVSILELIELPSSKSSSSMSIKVSLGKNTYEAEGQKGDFLFPLATFRDNLVVKVHDNKGNEIAHTGVKSRLIAEKGYWDDEFPLEGGGQIHMKLKFSLSEDERNRIRNMRESALRKKKEELLNRKMITAVASSGGGNEMPPPATIDLPLEASSKVVSLKEQIPQKKTNEQHYNLKEQILLEKKPPNEVKQDDQPYELKEQSPLEKTPSDGKPLNLKDHSALKKTPSKLQEDDQPYMLDEQSLIKEKPRELEEDYQPYKLKESKKEKTLQEDNQPYSVKDQSPLKKTHRKLLEDDQPYIVKDQSPLRETPSKLQENDQPYGVKDQSSLKETPSKLQEDDQPYGVKEQSEMEETPSRPQEGDQPYSVKEQSEMEETPSKLQKPGNLKDESPLEKTHSELQEDDDEPGNLKDESPLEKTHSKLQEDDQPYNMKEQTPLENTVSTLQEIDQNKCKEQSPLEETPTKVKVDDQIYNLKKPTPLEVKPSKVEEKDRRYKNPVEKTSSRIWETIAAFESSTLTKERTNTAKAQSSREQPTSILDETLPIETKYVDNVEYKSKEVLVEKEPKKKYPLHKIQPLISVTEQDYTCDRRGRCSCKNFQGWIFLEEAVCTCIVSDNRMVRDLHEDHNVDPETYTGKVVDEEVTLIEEDNKLPAKAKKPDSGPNGQIMRIVIMVGFGLLVLFTRSKKSR